MNSCCLASYFRARRLASIVPVEAIERWKETKIAEALAQAS